MLQTWMPTSLVSVWWGTRGFVCQLGRQRTVALDWKDLSLGFFQFGATQKNSAHSLVAAKLAGRNCTSPSMQVLERIRLIRGISGSETSIHLETYRVA